MTLSDVRLALISAMVMLGEACRYLVGDMNSYLEVLLVFMALDYASGIVVAYVSRAPALDSRRGLRGIMKKLFMLVLISIAHLLDKLSGLSSGEASRLITLFFIGNEGLSIIENAAKARVPIPAGLRRALAQLGDERSAPADERGNK